MSNPGSPNTSSYGEYLRVPDLLRLQATLSDAHDELQFIVVHQVFELWFKLMLFELEATRDAMLRSDFAQAQHYLRRVRSIVRLLTESFEVIETMRPYDFLQFRSRLEPASGFQSRQYREIEFISGLQDARYVPLFQGDDRAQMERRLSEPTLWDAYVRVLSSCGFPASGEPQVVESAIRVLEDPDRQPLGMLTEALIDYDEQFSLWRARHIRMTMRMIGRRPGTGRATVEKLVAGGYDKMGSAGVEYLESTLDKLFFPLLWEARTFVRR